MSAGTDSPEPSASADSADIAEGAEYGRALLARIAAGMGEPCELAALVQFLHSGPMLHGGCVVIFDALRILATQGGAR